MTSWQELYDQAVQAFNGEQPGEALEQELIEAFRVRPEAQRAAVARVAAQFAAGKVHSPWAVVRAEIRRDAARAGVVADSSPERELAIHLAELRVRNIGHVLPDAHELREELFGRRALLEPWAGDELLVARMLALWREQVAPAIVWPGH